jgi:hypothetical protein
VTDLSQQAEPGRGPEPLPQRGVDLPGRGAGLPQSGESIFQRSESLPQRNQPIPQRGQPTLPQRTERLPQRNDPLPQRGGPAADPGFQAGDPLPRRTGRTRPAGRHRSPHRLSVASDAPALLLAVPGTAEADVAGIGADVAAIASLSCPGVDIRVGYLEGSIESLSDLLGRPDEAEQPASVVVPLLLSPNERADAALHRAAGDGGAHVIVAAHLAPHPLVAEGLHARLADAGLARHARASGISISTGGRGIIVLSDIGEEAAGAAAVAAVMLASRLSVPVVPASLGEPASIAEAVTQLSMSGAPSPVLAPCLIGPEFSQQVLDNLSTALGAPMAAPLGAHQAVGQLVAVRYGAALARLSLAG